MSLLFVARVNSIKVCNAFWNLLPEAPLFYTEKGETKQLSEGQMAENGI